MASVVTVGQRLLDQAVLGACQVCFLVARLAIAGMAILVSCDVILRMVFRAPIPGAYELVGMLGALAVAGAMPQVQKTGSAIVIGLLVDVLPNTPQHWLRRATLLVEALFFAILTWQFWVATLSARRSGQVSDILQWPHWWVYALTTVGFAVVTLIAVWQLSGRQAATSEA